VGSANRLEGQRPHKFPKINLRKPNNFFGEELQNNKLNKTNSETTLPMNSNIVSYQKRRLKELNQINYNNNQNYQTHKYLNNQNNQANSDLDLDFDFTNTSIPSNKEVSSYNLKTPRN